MSIEPNRKANYGYKSFTNFSDLRAAHQQATQTVSADFSCNPLKVRAIESASIDSSNNLDRWISFDQTPLYVEPLATKQMYRRLGTAYYGRNRALPGDFMDAPGMSTQVWNAIINHGAQNIGSGTRNWRIRTTNDRGGTCRAIFTSRYIPFDGIDVLNMLEPYYEKYSSRYDAKLKNCILERDFTAVNFVMPASQFVDSPLKNAYQVGFQVATGETGLFAVEIVPFMLRTACMNSSRLLMGGISYRHIISATTIKSGLNDVIAAMSENFALMFDALVEAENVEIPDLPVVLRGFAIQNGYGQDTVEAALLGTENRQTLEGMFQGLTHAAKDLQAEMSARLQGEAVAALFANVRRTQKSEDTSFTWDMTSLTREDMADKVSAWRRIGQSNQKLPETANNSFLEE